MADLFDGRPYCYYTTMYLKTGLLGFFYKLKQLEAMFIFLANNVLKIRYF